MEQITLTREELIELAKVATFHLDDKLIPYSRETLRAEAWLQGFCFAKQHQHQEDKEEPVEPTPNMWPGFIREYIRMYVSYWLVCKSDFGPFRKGEHYWLELLTNNSLCGRSDNVKDQIINITIADLLNNFEATEDKV